jgi:hypothetical protein
MFRPAPLTRFAFVGALALVAAACGSQDGASPLAEAGGDTPDAAVMQSVNLLRANDFNGLVEASVPPARFEEAKTRWMTELKDEEITDENRAEFAETMAKLTAPDAEETLMAEIRPQLAQFEGEMKAQLPAMIAMGKGFVLAAINESQDIAAENKPQVTNLVNALGTWAESGEFASADRAEKAVEEVTAAARKMPVRTLDEVHALDFNGIMDVMEIAYGGFKGVLKAYDIDMDASLASARAETLSQDGDNAKVRVHFDFLGAPMNFDTQMVRVDGRWYGKDAIEELNKPAATADEADAS